VDVGPVAECDVEVVICDAGIRKSQMFDVPELDTASGVEMKGQQVLGLRLASFP